MKVPSHFLKDVWPAICNDEFIGGGTLTPVEGVTDADFARQLDIAGGIDAWQLVNSGGIRGIASRVQELARIEHSQFDTKRHKEISLNTANGY